MRDTVELLCLMLRNFKFEYVSAAVSSSSDLLRSFLGGNCFNKNRNGVDKLGKIKNGCHEEVFCRAEKNEHI